MMLREREATSRRAAGTSSQGAVAPDETASGRHLVSDERQLASMAVALGARQVASWSSQENAAAKRLPSVSFETVERIRRVLQKEEGDPLGEAFCALRGAAERRSLGATYTPRPIVDAMLAWAVASSQPTRIVDPGVGSGRFLLRAGRLFPNAQLIGIDIDPVATLVARGNLAAAGFAERSRIILGDFRDIELAPVSGQTLFVGNPPYVRHHQLGQKWKTWLTETAARLEHEASQLAGLHVHFFLATLLKAKQGDVGSFITAAEWLDVNYGRLVRELLTGRLGGRSLHIIEPTALPFDDAATTAVISCFEVGAKPPSLRIRRVAKVADLGNLAGGRVVRRERLQAAPRWTVLTRPARNIPTGYVELGELCRVHRGQVTGANSIWIAGAESAELPGSLLLPTVTRARELFAAGTVLKDSSSLKRVIDLPVDLDSLEVGVRKAVDRFLRWARKLGADKGFVAGNRKAWWSVGLRQPAPILATYMARRPPAFVRNRADARHINIAHGLYPRDPLPEGCLLALAHHLSRAVACSEGRTYAGGLTKFEPREMERIVVPSPAQLAILANDGTT